MCLTALNAFKSKVFFFFFFENQFNNDHPRYTSTNVHKHTLFLYFSDFSIFLKFLYEKKKKTKIEKKTNKNKLNKTMHKTRLTQNSKAKHTSNAKQKHEGKRK